MKALSSRTTHATAALAGAAATALVLSACAGGVSASQSAGEGDGFEYGASQEAVDEAIADLEPVTLTFQPASASPESVLAGSAMQMKELVEERSNGKIEIELIWGQAIADYATVYDALGDGRLDLAYGLPTYQPEEFPAFSDMAETTALLPASPFIGELLAYATYNDVGWSTPSIVEAFEEEGLTPLTPVSMTSTVYNICTDELTGIDDWQGRSMSVSNTGQFDQVQRLNASGVTLSYTEVFEALQRGTVDCFVGTTGAAVETGVLETAPNITYTSDVSLTRSPGAFLAGSSFKDLPLPYQQIIFDANQMTASEIVKGLSGAASTMIGEAKANGGTVTGADDEVQGVLREAATEMSATVTEEGRIGDDIESTIDEAVARWDQRIVDLGYADEGDTETFDQWYDDAPDFLDYAADIYENSAAMEHRPS